MLTIRRHPHSKPWWILGALLLPVLALPFIGPDYPRAIGAAMLLVFVLVHLIEVPAILRLADGRPLKIFGIAMLCMVPSVIGDTAAIAFVSLDTTARVGAIGHGQKCGLGATVLLLAVPFLSAAAHIVGGVVLAACAAVWNRLVRPPAHA